MVIKQYGGPGQPQRFFSFGGGKDNFFPVPLIVQTSYENMLRNGSFESWPTGVSARPGAWWLTSNGGTVTRSTSEWHGRYALQMVKHEGDGELNMSGGGHMQHGIIHPGILNPPRYTPPCYDQVYQDIYGKVGDLHDGSIWTLSGMASADTARHVRLFAYDDEEYRYSDYHTGSDDWEHLWVSFMPLSGSSRMRVGAQFEPITGSDVTTLLDGMMLVRGSVPHYYQDNQDEHNPICSGYNYLGSWLPLHGCYRHEAFRVSGTVSATPHTHSYTLNTGCRAISHVSLNLYSFGGVYSRAFVRGANYSTTGFDIKLEYYGTMTVGWAYVIDGVVSMLGWDDSTELWE